ncbi:MAG: hypothetical protein H7Z14_04020, partial [Anaerolineae bacterium]|nr:hypothetical protein [Phycisphaerae bacterium]
ESDMAPGIEKLCRAGFVMRNVKGVELSHVQVHGQLGPAILLNDVDGAFVHGCSVDDGKLVEQRGERTRNIVISNNRGATSS